MRSRGAAWKLGFAVAVCVRFVPALSAQVARPSLPVLPLDRDLSASAFDDAAWGKAPAASELFQQEPNEGQPATLSTECRVIATPAALLLRFVLVEPAKEIVAQELRRDADLSSDDRIAFVLDTYHDRRNAYFFATNPIGAREDGLVTEEGDPSLDWDGVWDVRVRRTAEGWEALFRIPYATLNFPGGPEGVWGFNFSRLMPRRTETARWTGWKRPFALSKISLAGDLAGLPALPRRRLREITPFGAAVLERLSDPSNGNLLGKAGLDSRYGISSSTELDLTANTDFAETEADAQQFNFGRTSLFFPEKRSFFLQRSQIFAFGDPDTTIPFFSRRIGLKRADDNVPIPIDAGLKLTGRLGRTDFGAIAIQTRRSEGEPRTDSFVARVKQDIGHSSYVGALLTDVERASGSGLPSHSRTWGLDTRWTPHPDVYVNAYYVDTQTPGVTGKTAAWSVDAFYNGEHARAELQRASFGSSYDPELGFFRQRGITLNYGRLGVIARPSWLGLRDVMFETFYFPKYNEDGSLNEREYQYTLRANWLNGAYMDDDLVDVFDEHLTEPLPLTDRVAIAPGSYHFVRRQIAFGTNPSLPFAFQANFNFGGYYAGRRDRYVSRIFWKPNEHLGVTVIEDYNAVRLPQGDFNLSLFSARIDWNASVRLLSSLIVQSDNVDRLTNVQAIVRWLIDPATDLFVVYSRQIGAGFERPGTRVTLKFRKTFDL